MTDKVQKIKDWISCQQDSLIDANGNFQHSEDEAAYHTLCSLDAYIDSLQEEPVSEDLEKDNEGKPHDIRERWTEKEWNDYYQAIAETDEEEEKILSKN